MSYINYLILLSIGLAIFIIALIYSSIRANINLKIKLPESFGRPPIETAYELESIKAYYICKAAHADNTFAIDSTTWDDLDMDKVFKRINVCLTSVGEEYLYDCLHNPLFEESKLLEREMLISFLKEQPDERLKIQMCLAKMGKSNFSGLSSLIYNAQGNLLKYPFVYTVLAVIPILCVGIMLISVNAGIACLILSLSQI